MEAKKITSVNYNLSPLNDLFNEMDGPGSLARDLKAVHQAFVEMAFFLHDLQKEGATRGIKNCELYPLTDSLFFISQLADTLKDIEPKS